MHRYRQMDWQKKWGLTRSSIRYYGRGAVAADKGLLLGRSTREFMGYLQRQALKFKFRERKTKT